MKSRSLRLVRVLQLGEKCQAGGEVALPVGVGGVGIGEALGNVESLSEKAFGLRELALGLGEIAETIEQDRALPLRRRLSQTRIRPSVHPYLKGLESEPGERQAAQLTQAIGEMVKREICQWSKALAVIGA